ncbi:NucA/NucB deoxyribonuclease domain-containing protein [Actinomadura sp. 9N407]|uniref:NucA/NucB deoxyribonuclease domain-containing protein n=1 Tax=Actinomadura sp. 9N407 TaxID=3375154 RepID=UPI00379C534E
MPKTDDPVPPPLCYKKPGQVNYDRFNACQQSTLKLTVTKDNVQELTGYIWWGVWETLPSSGGRSWKMNVGIRPYDMPVDMSSASPTAAVATQCNGHCDLPDPEQKSMNSNNEYVYFGEQDVTSSTSDIRYSAPWIGLAVQFQDDDIDPILTTWDNLSTPFNIRCDSESYIGSTGGCVHYMGADAIPSYPLSYTGPYAEIAQNALYGMTIGDLVYHYGNIQYGHPLTREDPHLIQPHRDSICTSSITTKANAMGLSCDEYPYASSEQGGSGNPRFSCAFTDEEQNEGQGRDMNGRFFVPNRILPAVNEVGSPYVPGDPFWVWVTEAPVNPPAVKQCSTY